MKRKPVLFDEVVDKDILDYMAENVKKKFTEYVRDLIREDMNRKKGNGSMDIATLLVNVLTGNLVNGGVDVAKLLSATNVEKVAEDEKAMEIEKEKNITTEDMSHLNKLLDDD